jgi:D-sedoheptulose 7-phosphate isomerase
MSEPRLAELFRQHLREHLETLKTVEAACLEPLTRLTAISAEALRRGGKLLFFGNGGSAADAQHLAAELSIRFVRPRRALAGLALTTDTSALTACGNDLGFDEIFSRQIEALGRPGDVAIGISTSGNSPNVLRGLEGARAAGLVAAAFAGRDGGSLAGVADPLVMAPAGSTARTQEIHILLGHMLCAGIEREMDLE